MKKTLFLLITLFSLVSCSSDDPKWGGTGGTDGGDSTSFDDWNNPRSPNYKPNGYNPIMGEWADFPIQDGYAVKYTFTSDFKYQKSYWNRIKKEWFEQTTLSTYKVNDKAFKTDKELPYSQDKLDYYPYELGTDEYGEYLIINYPITPFKYYRVK